MTLRQIAYLLAVADTGSFTAAARRMHVSQPSLSQQIRSLEAELGGALLERPPRPVALTAAGRAFATEARNVLTAARRAADGARATMDLEVRELRVATVRSLAVAQLPLAIRRWQDSHPGLTVHLLEHGHREAVADSVLAGVSELGIAPSPPDWPGVSTRLGWDEFLVVLPHADPLLESTRLPLTSLADREWVLFEPGHGLANLTARACARAGFEPRGIAFTAQVEAAARLATAGVGPALVPAKAVPSDCIDNSRPLDPPVVWEISAFAATTEWSPQHARLVEVLRGANWERQRPKGALQIRLDAAPVESAAEVRTLRAL